MPRRATPSPGALAQRKFRERMAKAGLVARQVYIRPENVPVLARIEQTLRMPRLPAHFYLMESHEMTTQWTTTALFDALKDSEYCKSGRAAVSMEHNGEAVIHIDAHDHGNLPMQMIASGSEVHVSTVLCFADQVKDLARFNDACLRLNPIYPLSNIGLSRVGDQDAYVVFGQLSAYAPLANVVEEIHTLGHNATQAANELAHHLH